MDQDHQSEQAGRTRIAWLAGLGLVLFTALAYLPVWHCGFVWDDDHHVTANPVLTAPDGLRQIWLEPRSLPQYYPLVHTTFWLEYRLWGLAPRGYHLVNVALHALAALLLWRVLVRLGVPGAWLAAAVFALHPVHVESVAWITERKNVLSAACALAALLALLHFLDWHWWPELTWRRGRGALYGLALLLFTGAVLSKTVTCALPAVVLVLMWWQRPRLAATDWARLGALTAPFFAIGAALAAGTVYLERYKVGAIGPEWDLSLLDRILIAGRAVWFYLGKLLWPSPLIFIYPRWQVHVGDWRQYAAPAAIVLLAVVLFAGRRQLGRGPLAALLIFGGVLLPALGFFNVYPHRYSFVADHFQYLASIGVTTLLSAALVCWLTGAAGSSRPARWRRVLGLAVAALWLLSLGTQTWRSIPRFRDAESLWRHTLACNDGAWMAHHNLGLLLVERGQWVAAERHFRAAVTLKPDHAHAHSQLAELLARRGDLAGAAAHYERSVRAAPRDPTIINRLGNYFARRRDFAKAVTCYQQALALAPELTDALVNLGHVQAEQGRREEAVATYRRVLAAHPDHLLARLSLCQTLLALGQRQAVLTELAPLRQARPDAPAVRALWEAATAPAPPP